MPASVLQHNQTSTGSATSTTLTITLSNVTAGSTIVVFTANDDAQAAPTVADSANAGNYTALDNKDDTVNGERTCSFIKSNVVHTAGTVTYTATWSPTATGFRAIWVGEVGVAATSSLDGHAANLQASAPTTTDGVTVGPPSPNNANAPVLAVGISVDNSGGGAPAVGTGCTDQATAWDFGTGTGNLARAESRRFTGLSAALTWTNSHSGDGITSLVVLVDESGSTPLGGVAYIFGDAVAE